MFPNEKGFSYRNIRYIKQWYLFYYEEFTIWHQAGAKLPNSKMHQLGAKLLQQPAVEMPEDFALVPWKHHVAIISKSKSLDEALFYINEVIAGNWSRSRLEDEIKSDLYARQGKAITNFSRTLELPQQQLAQEILKDPLDFNFLHLQKGYNELSERRPRDDRETKYLKIARTKTNFPQKPCIYQKKAVTLQPKNAINRSL